MSTTLESLLRDTKARLDAGETLQTIRVCQGTVLLRPLPFAAHRSPGAKRKAQAFLTDRRAERMPVPALIQARRERTKAPPTPMQQNQRIPVIRDEQPEPRQWWPEITTVLLIALIVAACAASCL